MFGIIKKIFIVLLSTTVNVPNRAKFVSLSNQKCEIWPTLINLHLNEYSQEFHYHSFAVKLDRCVGSCNTLNDLSDKVCVPSKTEDLNLSAFNRITWINESKTLTKHISCESKFDNHVIIDNRLIIYHVNLMKQSVIQINGGIKTNVNVSVKKFVYVKKLCLESFYM